MTSLLWMIVLLNINGGVYKVVWGEERNGYPTVSSVEQIPNAEIKTVNNITQIITHFGTFTENDSNYVRFSLEPSYLYFVYNELENLTYLYDLDGEIKGIDQGNLVVYEPVN